MVEITGEPQRAIERLASGALVAIPTETVYGLAADAANPQAVAKVFALKGRPSSNPLIVHLHHTAAVDAWASEVGATARRLMDAFWPGPLTLVLKAQPGVSRLITAGQDSVALRVPAHPMALQVLRGLGRALVAPSANRYMGVSPTTAEHVASQFADEDLLVLDGGPCGVGLESTIVGVLPGRPPCLLRPGMIDVETLQTVASCVVEADGSGDLRAPGQHRRHYAPRTPALGFRIGLEGCIDLGDDVVPDGLASVAALRGDPATGWILCGARLVVAGPCLELGQEAVGYARGLYAALHRLDSLRLQRILVQWPPETPAWRPIRDRLSRALQRP